MIHDFKRIFRVVDRGIDGEIERRRKIYRRSRNEIQCSWKRGTFEIVIIECYFIGINYFIFICYIRGIFSVHCTVVVRNNFIFIFNINFNFIFNINFNFIFSICNISVKSNLGITHFEDFFIILIIRSHSNIEVSGLFGFFIIR